MIYGVWFIKGGMYSLVLGMEKLFKELGGVVHLNSKVEKIVVENQKAVGIKVGDQVEEAGKILCNADFPYAMKNLLNDNEKEKRYRDEKIDKMGYSCSCFMMYLGIDKNLDQFDLHNILFGNDFDGNIDDIFEGRIPMDASMYFYRPTQLDPSLAPEGKEVLYVLVPVPNLTHKNISWDDERTQSYKEHIYSRIAELPGMENFKDHVEFEKIYTPLDFESRFNAYNGATFGLAPTLLQSNYFRPQGKSKKVDDLYFVGSSVHPGAGVPIVLTSAKLAVENIMMDTEEV